MPHNLWAPEELDARYPTLKAVGDQELDDFSRLEDERFYAAGMRVFPVDPSRDHDQWPATAGGSRWRKPAAQV